MRTTLLDHPEKAAMIASGIAIMSEMEVMLPSAFANAIGVSQAASRAILMQFRNVADRLDVIRDVLASLPQKSVAASALEGLVAPIREVNSFRNELAHGCYSAGPEGQLHLFTWVLAKARKTEVIDLTDQLLNDHLVRSMIVAQHLGHVIARPLEPLPDSIPPIPPAARQRGHIGKASRSGKQPPPRS